MSTVEVHVYNGDESLGVISRQPRFIDSTEDGNSSYGVIYRRRVYELVLAPDHPRSLVQDPEWSNLVFAVDELDIWEDYFVEKFWFQIDVSESGYATDDCSVTHTFNTWWLNIPIPIEENDEEDEDPELITFTFETTANGRRYVALDGDEETVESVVDSFQEHGLEVMTYGRSHRAAADGLVYDWYIRLAATAPPDEMKSDVRAALQSSPDLDSSPIRILKELESRGLTLTSNGTEVLFRGDIAQVNQPLVDAVLSSKSEILEILKARGQTEASPATDDDRSVHEITSVVVNGLQTLTWTSFLKVGLVSESAIPAQTTSPEGESAESAYIRWMAFCQSLFSSIKDGFSVVQAELEQQNIALRQGALEAINVMQNLRSGTSTLENRLKAAEFERDKLLKTIAERDAKEPSHSASPTEVEELRKENLKLKADKEVAETEALKTIAERDAKEPSHSASPNEVEELRKENRKLKDDLQVAEDEAYDAWAKLTLTETKISNLETDKANGEARLKAFVTNQPIGASEQLEIAMESLVPRIELVYTSFDRIQSFADPTGAYDLLAEVNAGKTEVNAGKTSRNKTVQTGKGFREVRFDTGIPGDDGRFYYRPKEGRVQVLVSVKDDQDRDIRRLRRLRT